VEGDAEYQRVFWRLALETADYGEKVLVRAFLESLEASRIPECLEEWEARAIKAAIACHSN
jgi:hypothetical protein